MRVTDQLKLQLHAHAYGRANTADLLSSRGTWTLNQEYSFMH